MVLSIFYLACLKTRFPDVEENPGPVARPPARCRMLFSNINGLHANLQELGIAASSHDVVFCAETRATNRRHVAELRLPCFSNPTLLPCGGRDRVRGLALYVRDGFSAHRQARYECGCCESFVVRVCGARQNFYLFGAYRNPDLDDHIFDCFLSAMADIQAADRHAAFVFVGDFNGHHEEWLGSSRTDVHGRAALEFATLSGCSQLVRGPTHRDGGVLDLVLTDVPDLVKVSVRAGIGRSDHSQVSVAISCAVRVPDVCVCRTVYLKTRVDWLGVLSDLRCLDWHSMYVSDAPIEMLEAAVHEIIEARVPRVNMRLRNRDRPWFDDACRRAFDHKQACYHRWCRDRSQLSYNAFLEAQRTAKRIYEQAEFRHLTDSRHRLMETQNSKKWWSVLSESLFGISSTIPPLLGSGGGLLVTPREKAVALSEQFDSKQSRAVLHLPATCHPEPGFQSFAFRSKEVYKLLAELDTFGGVDPSGAFPLFFKMTAKLLAPKLSRIFRLLVGRGCFPSSWRRANVVPLPKGPASPVVANYRPISITAVLSKVFEKLVSRRLDSYLRSNRAIPDRQYAYRKGVSTCDALLEVSHTLQEALDAGKEGRLVQIDFSGAFDKVNHAGLLFKLAAVGVGGSVLSIIRNFLSCRTQCVVLDGAASDPVSVVSGVPQGSVLGPLLFSLYTSDLFSMLENKLVGYADDSTLVAIVPSPSSRLAVSASLNRDLARIADWCSAWGMVLNARKTRSMIVSRSRTLLPVFPALELENSFLEESRELPILGVTFDSKLTFGTHVQSVASSAARKLGLMRKAGKVFGDRSLIVRCFWAYLLPVLEYCSPVWNCAADCHLRPLDRVVRGAVELSGGLLKCDLQHRRSVASLCMFYKIATNPSHPLHQSLPGRFAPLRRTRQAVSLHEQALAPVRCRTEQFSRSFVPRSVIAWNSLDASVFAGDDLSAFKSAVNRFLLHG